MFNKHPISLSLLYPQHNSPKHARDPAGPRRPHRETRPLSRPPTPPPPPCYAPYIRMQAYVITLLQKDRNVQRFLLLLATRRRRRPSRPLRFLFLRVSVLWVAWCARGVLGGAVRCCAGSSRQLRHDHRVDGAPPFLLSQRSPSLTHSLTH